MMKLYLKYKIFSWNIRYLVKDEKGNNRFIVKEDLSTKDISVYDAYGTEVACIRKKFRSWLVNIKDHVVCEIIKKFALFKPSYSLIGLPWHFEGNFLARDYWLADGERQIMRLSKKTYSWGGNYQIGITNPRDELLCLCIVLAVDQALIDYNNKMHSE